MLFPAFRSPGPGPLAPGADPQELEPVSDDVVADGVSNVTLGYPDADRLDIVNAPAPDAPDVIVVVRFAVEPEWRAADFQLADLAGL